MDRCWRWVERGFVYSMFYITLHYIALQGVCLALAFKGGGEGKGKEKMCS